LDKPTNSSFSSTMVLRTAAVSPRSSSPKPTFSRTVRHGSSPNCWNTIATRSRRTRRIWAVSQVATSMAESPALTSTCPRVTGFNPLAARSSVDFPGAR